ncbi:MAG: Ada metal-binding domain-containing protein, partial [Burkholderiaceae bacterium]
MDTAAWALDDSAAYQVITARDARFDGRLFVGVTSTGIYCRPICRVRTPLRRNCRFFATPAQAEAAAFRPCLKCRPEIAPGAGLPWSVMDASATLARQAADALDTHAAGADTPSLASIAARLGVSDRHLRRIFQAEHGVTPLQYLQTRRLLLAKQLLTDTRLPVTQVALASGYRSLRRFNAAFVESYRMSPSRLRGEADDPAFDGEAALTVKLAYRAPYDAPSLLRFLAQRAIPGVEAVEGRRVRRSLRAGSVAPQAGWIEAEFDLAAPIVRLRFAPALAGASGRVVVAARRWLDLDAVPQTIDAALANLPGGPGLRLPGSLDAFELAVRAILGQQVTVAAARTLARRVVERFGAALATPWDDVSRSFPPPAALAEAPVERLAELGIIRARAGAIQAIAQAWPEIAPLLAPRARPEPLIERLCALSG